MSIQELKARQRKVVEEAFNKGNVNAWDEILAPDFIFHLPPNPDIKGLNAFKQHMISISQGFSEIKYNLDEMIGEDNTSAVRYTMRMKHTGVSPRFPISPTGKEVVLKSAVFAHWKNGKIVEVFENADMMGLLQQLGIIPTMGRK